MQTDEFIKRVVPPSAHAIVAVKTPDGMRHFNGRPKGWAGKAALRIDAAGCETFFACAGYKDTNFRQAVNVCAVRAFWLDLDVGVGKPYGTQGEALEALQAFCRRLSLGEPLLVDSGYGIHVWFPLDIDLAPKEWKATAELLKAATKAWGLQADPSRTADIASLLRLPGTTNRKHGGARPVHVLHEGDIYDPQAFRAALETFLGSHSGAPGVVRHLGLGEMPTWCAAFPIPEVLVAAGSDRNWFDRLEPDQKDECLAWLLRSPSVVAAADASRDEWIKVVAACARSGAPGAREICRRWSQISAKYRAGDFDLAFSSFEGRHVAH